MSKGHTAYLSLGSNLGNRFHILQKGIFEIGKRIGIVLEISSVYETPAVGFEGDDFLLIFCKTPHSYFSSFSNLLK